MEESTNLKMLLAGNYILTAFRKSDFNKFVITSVQELSIVSLTELVCTVYPDVLHSIDCAGTKMIIMFFSLNVWFLLLLCERGWISWREWSSANPFARYSTSTINITFKALYLFHFAWEWKKFKALLGGENIFFKGVYDHAESLDLSHDN